MSAIDTSLRASNFDYLNALPVEIWREILAQTARSWTFIPNPSDPISYLRDTNINQLLSAQSERMELLLICKSFKPLAEEFIFAEVMVGTPKAFEGFITMASKQTSLSRCNGHWTKVFVILEDERGTKREHPGYILNHNKLITACPNLTSIRLESTTVFPLPELHTNSLVVNWGPRLHTLNWKHRVTWNDLNTVSTWCPNLKELTLRGPSGISSDITFPSVQYLYLTYLFLWSTNPRIFKMPSLRFLRLETRALGAVQEFIYRQVPTLDLLALYGLERPYQLHIGDHIFKVLACMKTLVLQPRNLQLEAGEDQISFSRLTEIVMDTRHLRDLTSGSLRELRSCLNSVIPNPLQYATYFSKNRFPSLNSVGVIIPNSYNAVSRSVVLDYIDYIQEMFPHLSVLPIELLYCVG